jgi:hypothetical protein
MLTQSVPTSTTTPFMEGAGTGLRGVGGEERRHDRARSGFKLEGEEPA